jgi:hypothetical protein
MTSRPTTHEIRAGGPSADHGMSDVGGGCRPDVSAVVAADEIRCAHCGGPIEPRPGRRGRPPRFCCPAHKEAARLRRERGLPERYPRQANHHGRRRLAGAEEGRP